MHPAFKILYKWNVISICDCEHGSSELTIDKYHDTASALTSLHQ